MMCEPDKIRRIQGKTNREIRRILAALNRHARSVGDEELGALIIRLRNMLAKQILLDEIRPILAELNGHARSAGDEKLEALIIRLRETLGKRVVLNGIADWQREG